MTEFTKERIERLQWMVTNDVESKSAYVALVVLDEIVNQADEIERLQQRIAELEQERQWIHQDKTLILKKDGDSWCAVLPDFEDLQQSESRWFSGDINKYMDDVYWYLKHH